MACGLYLSGKYEAAVEVAKRVVRLNPDYPLPYRWLAAALGQLGRTEDAKNALEKAIAAGPASFGLYVRRVPWHRPEDHAHMLKGLRKAGWREESDVFPLPLPFGRALSNPFRRGFGRISAAPRVQQPLGHRQG
ncbi:MAG: tetratricopeptide repeat protein [Alphaproteobacteria bacterium]|nr:tetratricopeptide repeat protein [Alphaproteobacteria bacterium]